MEYQRGVYSRRDFLKVGLTGVTALASGLLVPKTYSYADSRNPRPKLRGMGEHFLGNEYQPFRNYSFIAENFEERERGLSSRFVTRLNGEKSIEHNVVVLEDRSVIFDDGDYISFIPEKRRNKFTARIFDERRGRGRRSLKYVDRFNVQAKEGAFQNIENLLLLYRDRFIDFERSRQGVNIDIGTESVNVLFVVYPHRRINRDESPAVFNYVDIGDDINRALADQRLLRENRIHAFYFFRLAQEKVPGEPREEIGESQDDNWTQRFTRAIILDEFTDLDRDVNR